MKYLALFLVLLLTQCPLLAQSCQQVQIATTARQKEVLRKYIEECKQKRYLSQEKGIIELVTFKNEDSLACWHINALRDDRYHSLPPKYYTVFDGYIILVYKGNEIGYRLPIAGDKNNRDTCIQAIVGTRVHKRPAEKQFVELLDENGKTRKYPVTRLQYGNENNGLIIRFNKDGTISEFIPV